MKKIVRRLWINKDRKDLSAFLIWWVKPNRTDLKDSDIEFKMSDCSRQISLEFSIFTKEQRERSVAKAGLLLKEITDFHVALTNLCHNIDK